MTIGLNYYGNRGVIWVHYGTLNTDRYGLDTATCQWKAPQDSISSGNALGSPHPKWPYLEMEKRRIDIEPGYLVITGDYAGVRSDTLPIYEASFGTAQEDIRTHPNFVSVLAGTAASPLNNAIWVDINTGEKSTSNATAVFREFGPGSLLGTTDYLSPQITVRKTWVSQSPTTAPGLGSIGSPGIGVSAVNWLVVGAGFQQRGNAYVNSIEWRSSGRRGWNTQIYT